MFIELLLAFVQAATEFLPVSSSGHLALVSHLIGGFDVSFFVVLHLASLLAVLWFTRRELWFLLRFDAESFRLWKFLFLGTLPAALVGFFFSGLVESLFSSLFFLGCAFLFTAIILFSTKFCSGSGKLSFGRVLLIGLFQVLALFPGVSRSGMTISSALFVGVDRRTAARFSFLLFIPLALGAFVLEFEKVSFSFVVLVSFVVCLLLSLLFLQLLVFVVEKGKFWWFSFYCLLVSLVCFFLFFLL